MVLGIDCSQANREIRSGTEWYAFYLLSEFKRLLRDRGDVCVWLYFRDQPQDDILADLPANFEIKILRWPLKYFWVQKRLSLEMLFHPPDILFCPAHTIPLIHPKKTYTTLHDIGFIDNPELYDKLSLWYHRFSAWLAVKSAYHIFTVSEFTKQRILDYFHCLSQRITVTHLGIATKSTTAQFAAIAKKFGFKEKQYILYVGRLEPKKNILGMVKAYEMANSSMPLVFAGRKVQTKGVDKYLSSRPKLGNRVKFLSYVSEQDKHALYSGAAIFLFPTLYEGFGLPILEAQQFNVPVITSNFASNPEIAGEAALVVNPKNPIEIASAIRKLLADENLREKLVTLGRENLRRFKWQETAHKTLKIMGFVDQDEE